MHTRSLSLLRPHRWGALAICALLLLAGWPSARHLTAATTYTVTWGASRNVSNSTIKTIFPSVAVDSNDHTHIVFVTDDTSGQNLLYVNNVSGSFSAPQVVRSKVGSDRNPFFSLAAGPNNTLHLVYSLLSEDKQIYYQRGTISGASTSWSEPRNISSTERKSVAANLAVGDDGTVHVVWADQRCDGSHYNVYYRAISPTGGISNTSQPVPRCTTAQGKPRVVVTADGKPHVVLGSGGDVYHARLDGSAWATTNISNSSGVNDDNPALATDGTALYLPWDEGVGGHNVVFRRSTDGGQSWSNKIDLSGDPDTYASFPSAVYSATSQRVYIAWQDTFGTGSGQDEIWYREFDPSDGTTTEAKRLTTLSGSSALPSIAVGPGKAGLAWHDKSTGQWQIFVATGDIIGGCSGTLKLDGGVSVTNKTDLPAELTPSVNCTPAQMQIGIDALPDANAPKEAYQSSFSLPVTPNGCTARSVYVKLYDAQGRSGAPAAAKIKIDTEVNATVAVMNPHMQGLPKAYTPPKPGAASAPPPRLSDAQGTLGASDGHPNYTRDRAFFLGISDGGDCAGLKQYDVPGSISGEVPTNGVFSVIALPGSSTTGERSFQVVISDTLKNTGMFPSSTNRYQIVYDPPSTSPTITNTDGLPVLAEGGSVAGDSATKSIIRTLSFSGISVSDNLYGQAEGLAAGKQFWGVWVANSTQDADPSTLALRWFPVEVPAPDASFTIIWNLFNGLNYGPDTQKSGTYYVYVRFLDGAGNPSSGYIKTSVTLESGYRLPTVRLPLVLRR